MGGGLLPRRVQQALVGLLGRPGRCRQLGPEAAEVRAGGRVGITSRGERGWRPQRSPLSTMYLASRSCRITERGTKRSRGVRTAGCTARPRTLGGTNLAEHQKSALTPEQSTKPPKASTAQILQGSSEDIQASNPQNHSCTRLSTYVSARAHKASERRGGGERLSTRSTTSKMSCRRPEVTWTPTPCRGVHAAASI